MASDRRTDYRIVVIFLTYEEKVAYIEDLPMFTKKNSLSHTRELLHRLGDPQERMRIIHVAGSNGKGSFCSFLHQTLMEAGYRTAMFTSPHLRCLNERFVINGHNCTDEVFEESFDVVFRMVKKAEKEGMPHPSYFEFLFLMGMVLFERQNVSFLILETGLGGRLDATNSILHPEYTVITSISLEHTEILGDTIEQIAAEKAGIIKKGVPIIYDASQPQAAVVIAQVAAEKQAPCYAVHPTEAQVVQMTAQDIVFRVAHMEVRIPFVAEYQIANAMLAIQVLWLLHKRGVVTKEQIITGLSHTKWPGRMQQIRPEIFLDGAHNLAGIGILLKTVKRIQKEPPILVFSMVKEKDYHKVVQLLATEIAWDTIYVTQMHTSRGIPAQMLAEEFSEAGRSVCCIPDKTEAIRQALRKKRDGQLLICTGSLYLLGELLEEFNQMEEYHD